MKDSPDGFSLEVTSGFHGGGPWRCTLHFQMEISLILPVHLVEDPQDHLDP